MATNFYSILDFGTGLGEWFALSPGKEREIKLERNLNRAQRRFQHFGSEKALGLPEM